ncbi:PilZ domain-containing protein [Salidesulfovibrio onnuriiensis]|uniref:PilZ domain-containing protein n=1 Tax=Salidesulfovibrio onnuriiensis TaxID=2583823 RepID=UPI0011CC39D0|nr:PilZ domain-containing protein [Salidesulfovibrio onnuriiensis]
MIPHAQLDYLRDVQQTFAHGSGRLDVIEVFSMILAFVVPLVSLAALWYYRRYLWFLLVRLLTRMFLGKSQGIIENYLVSKGVVMEVSILEEDGTVGRNVCFARIETVLNGKLMLQLVKAAPTRVDLRGKRVICFVKQFALRGKKYNSFVTYIHSFERKGTVLKKMVLLTPMRYRFIIRRRHVRKRVNRPDIIRIKAWDIAKRHFFHSKKPDLYSVPDPARYEGKTFLEVGNISAGGLRLFVRNPRGHLPSLRVNDQLVLRISLKDPGSRQFFYFTVIGTIRSRFRADGNCIGLGLQFTALGEKMVDGTGRFSWSSVSGEIKALDQFLKKFE